MKKRFANIALLILILTGAVVCPAYDTNGFDPATLLPPPLCGPPPSPPLCDVTFAKDFPSFTCCGGTFSVFAIAFMPNGNVFVADNAPGANFLYIFPTDQAPGTAGPGCPSQPTGVLGYDGSAGSAFRIADPDYTSLGPPATTRGILDFIQLPNGKIYVRAEAGVAPFGRIVELTYVAAVFTTGPIILPAGVDVVGGAAYDPASGGIFYADTGKNIHIFDPLVPLPAGDVVLGNYPFIQSDGVVVRQDSCLGPGSIDQVYFADLGGNNVVGFDVTRGALGVPTSVTFAQALCTGFASPDGIAIGLPTSCLANKLFANSNSGSMYITDLNPPPGCSNFATGGTRGDFVKVSGKGWLYATQSTSITEIRDNVGNTALWSDQLPCSCQSVKQFACSLSAGGCVPAAVLISITAACTAITIGDLATAGANMLGAIDQLCPIIGTGTIECQEKKKALIAEMAQFMECQGIACGAAVLASHCPSVTLPIYPFACTITPSPTPITSATSTGTISPTFTLTPTITETGTITLTRTDTATVTQTGTVTPTFTETFTSTQTTTVPPTATVTLTAVPTATQTSTPAPCCPTNINIISVVGNPTATPTSNGENCFIATVSISGSTDCLITLEAHPGNGMGNIVPLGTVVLATSPQTFNFSFCIKGGNLTISALVNGVRCGINSNKFNLP